MKKVRFEKKTGMDTVSFEKKYRAETSLEMPLKIPRILGKGVEFLPPTQIF